MRACHALGVALLHRLFARCRTAGWAGGATAVGLGALIIVAAILSVFRIRPVGGGFAFPGAAWAVPHVRALPVASEVLTSATATWAGTWAATQLGAVANQPGRRVTDRVLLGWLLLLLLAVAALPRRPGLPLQWGGSLVSAAAMSGFVAAVATGLCLAGGVPRTAARQAAWIMGLGWLMLAPWKLGFALGSSPGHPELPLIPVTAQLPILLRFLRRGPATILVAGTALTAAIGCFVPAPPTPVAVGCTRHRAWRWVFAAAATAITAALAVDQPAFRTPVQVATVGIWSWLVGALGATLGWLAADTVAPQGGGGRVLAPAVGLTVVWMLTGGVAAVLPLHVALQAWKGDLAWMTAAQPVILLGMLLRLAGMRSVGVSAGLGVVTAWAFNWMIPRWEPGILAAMGPRPDEWPTVLVWTAVSATLLVMPFSGLRPPEGPTRGRGGIG